MVFHRANGDGIDQWREVVAKIITDGERKPKYQSTVEKIIYSNIFNRRHVNK